MAHQELNIIPKDSKHLCFRQRRAMPATAKRVYSGQDPWCPLLWAGGRELGTLQSAAALCYKRKLNSNQENKNSGV